MRVLVISDVSPVVVLGGSERALWEGAKGLAARGHQVRLVCRAPDGETSRTLVHQGVPIRYFAVDRRSLARFVRTSIVEARRAVVAEVSAHGADVLHVQQPLSALGALTSPAGRRLPSLYTFHSPAPLEYRLRRGMTGLHRGGAAGYAGAGLLWTIERASLRRATRLHVLSEFSAQLLRRLYRIPRERIVKIPGGVDIDHFRPAPDRPALRRELGLPADRPLLFTLRNLEPRMGLDNLIRALDLLRRRRPDVLLLVGGAGPLRRELQALAQSLNLDAQVRFLGFVADAELPRYYAAADAFVLPTRALEGFGLVTVEALACGTPVLGTPVGATPEILAPLSPALVFDDATAGAMAGGLWHFVDQLERDPPAIQRLREASRRHAEAHYSWSRSVGDLETALGRLTGGAAAGGDEGCPVCGEPRTRDFTHHGRRYRVCRRCRTGVAAAPPSPAVLRRFYEREYPARFAPERIGVARTALFGELLDRLPRAPARRRLLDLGCGGGQFLAAAAEQGWRAVGSDVSHEACLAALKASDSPIIQADSGSLPVRDRSVDAVTLVNVLDHLADPRRVLAEARRVLVPGGALVVRVPNGAFHRGSSRVLGLIGPLARWTGLGRYPVLHVFSFIPRGLRLLVERAGFEVVDVRNSPLTAEGPAATDAAPGHLPGALRAFVAGAAGAVAVASARRWLVAPSIELYARRPAQEDPAAP